MKKLPQWNSLIDNFPNKPAEDVFTEIGGKVKLNYDIGVFSNACATRISRTLNLSGKDHEIPFYKTKDSNDNDVIQVSSGGRKLWYIYRVKVITQYLKETYGQPKIVDPNSYKRDLSGKKGIIIFEVSGWSDATGHTDLWNGVSCVGSDYGDKASQIFFWEAF
ncbi:type VI secretion system amidase effector protein Tae4 [Thalassolituus oleivorans]|uniref:type VI secretion system amidase effector protein Tae4 n=1 Tax=Thalassolituus oleivorans TaxID=187493 RepID=UPI0023EF91E8|nr:type VI secretion system amidase effector protein Tae4 [Thalassolituus oleivorans]